MGYLLVILWEKPLVFCGNYRAFPAFSLYFPPKRGRGKRTTQENAASRRAARFGRPDAQCAPFFAEAFYPVDLAIPIWIGFMESSASDNGCAKFLRRAEYYQAEGLTKHALVQLNRAVKAAPELAEPRLCRAECLRRQGRLDEARADLEVAVAQAPSNPEPCVILAQTLAAKQEYAAAFRYLDRAELIDADWHRIYLIRGDILLASGAIDDALANYRRAVLLAPGNVEALTSLAFILLDLGDDEEALDLAKRALASSPNCIDARLVRAMALANRGQTEKGLAELNRACRISPDHLRARLERGALLLRLNRMDEAFADFSWVVGEEPDNERALYGLGESAWRSERVREAIGAFGRLTEMGLATVDVHLGRAEALALAGRREEAVEECTRALELEPKNPDIYASRGAFNMEVGRYDEAMRDLSKAIALDGDLVEAIIARGDLRGRRGDWAGATADFAVAVRLSPDEPELVGRWIRSIGDAGDPVTALKLLEREVERHPDNYGLQLLKGDLLFEAMRPDAAQACYRGIVEQVPNEMEPHLRLAEFYERRSEWDAALSEYDSAMRLEPSDPFPRLMRAALLSRMGKENEAERERAAASDLRRSRGR